MDQAIDVPLPIEINGGTEAERQDDKGDLLRPRYYQLEMLEESLKVSWLSAIYVAYV